MKKPTNKGKSYSAIKKCDVNHKNSRMYPKYAFKEIRGHT